MQFRNEVKHIKLTLVLTVRYIFNGSSHNIID